MSRSCRRLPSTSSPPPRGRQTVLSTTRLSKDFTPWCFLFPHNPASSCTPSASQDPMEVLGTREKVVNVFDRGPEGEAMCQVTRPVSCVMSCRRRRRRPRVSGLQDVVKEPRLRLDFYTKSILTNKSSS